MKNSLFFSLIFFLILPGLCPSSVQSQVINQSESKIVFRVGNMLINTVEGTFKGMKGAINFNLQDLSSSGFDVCVDVATIETGIEKREDHLKEEIFFYAEKYPLICFKSQSIAKTEDGYRVAGDLTIRDVTRTIEFPFTFDGKTFEGSFELERLDYNVGKGYSRLVADNDVEVRIVCVIE